MKRLLAFAVLLAACAPAITPVPTPVATVTPAAKFEGGEITFGVNEKGLPNEWVWKSIPITDPASPGFGSVNWPEAAKVSLRGDKAVWRLWQTPKGSVTVILDDFEGKRIFSFSLKTIEGSDTEVELSEYVKELEGTETPWKEYQAHLEEPDVLWVQVGGSDLLWLSRPKNPKQWVASLGR